MATVPLIPEAEEDIVTGDLITALPDADISTGGLLGAEAIVGLEPLGDPA